MRWLVLLLALETAWGQGAVHADYLRAWQLVGDGKPEEAIPRLRAIVEGGSLAAPVFRLLAWAYTFDGRNAEGEQYFRGLVARSPTNAAAHYGLAQIMGGSQRRDEMVAEASECARADPSFHQCYQIVADLLARSAGDKKVEDLWKLLPTDPTRAEVQFAGCRFHLNRGNSPAAIAAGEKAVQLAAERKDTGLLTAAESALASTYSQNPGLDVQVGRRYAESACRHAQTDPDPEEEFEYCAPYTSQVHGGDSAESRFEELIAKARDRRNPMWESRLEHAYAVMLASVGKVDEALSHNANAISLVSSRRKLPDLTNLERFRGELNLRTGFVSEAIEAFEQALAVAQNREYNPVIRAHILAKLTVAHNQAGNALEAIRTAGDVSLLFTDVVLPGGMNGRQLADEARRRRPDLKVLFTTGYTRNAIIHHGRLDADVDLLTKPFTSEQLLTKIVDTLHLDGDVE